MMGQFDGILSGNVILSVNMPDIYPFGYQLGTFWEETKLVASRTFFICDCVRDVRLKPINPFFVENVRSPYPSYRSVYGRPLENMAQDPKRESFLNFRFFW